MSAFRGAVVSLLAVPLVVAGVGVAQAGPEARGGCGEVANPSIRGARAHWELSCAGGQIRVSGYVEDTSANGRCAKVKAVFPGGDSEFSEPACPEGNRKHFDWRHPGSTVSVYLFEYEV
ncbi:hypothetical protein [Actinosynnema sp. NPDC020468]|uniref:hypothetical protein n=1 Tax=Actinosynnema sp. NPDC020468 TaxID=3154488 RepID=UPI0033C85B60